ncbi:MAG: phosphate ABC transporter substrate-binding protein PstS, partial [Gemmatimonadaceae bacterium]
GKGGPFLRLPSVIGGVAISYNLPGVTAPLKVDGAVVADIYLGRITKWNDSRVAALNPGVALPDEPIVVVHRSDGSGTTYIVTDYLSAVSAAWASGPGKGTAISWPVGLGAKGNEGVAGQVRQIEGAIGYVELAYVLTNHMAYAVVKNRAGKYVAPSLDGATAAAAGTAEALPANSDFRVSIVNAPGAAAYPISSFTWILMYTHQTDAAKGRKLVEFIKWAMTSGDRDATSLDYATLPANMKAMVLKRLAGVTY